MPENRNKHLASLLRQPVIPVATIDHAAHRTGPEVNTRNR
jgi:hypothetical protein